MTVAMQTQRVMAVLNGLDALYPEIEAFYTDLHAHPELSMQEMQTAEKVAKRLRDAGYDVTTGVGKTGVVALLHNGDGPMVMLRADMDALPVEEKTGLPYASKVRVKNQAGEEVPVAHACGHDVHTSCLIGTARLLAQGRQQWRGTLMLIAQPGEETMQGAEAMLKDGLFTRFKKPDIAIGQHTSPGPVGLITYTPGYAMAAVDNLRIRIFGKGSHGSRPQVSIDPVVMASALVMRLQTIVAREVDPQETAIVTVGMIQAGTRYNVIPDQAVLELTVRTFKPEVRDRVLASIRRIAKAEAEASNAPREPEFTVLASSPPLYNDPGPTKQIMDAFRSQFGSDRVMQIPPATPSEDFTFFGHVPGGAGIPSVYYQFGTTDPETFKKRGGVEGVPNNHSPEFAPVREPSLKMGMQALTVAALTMLGDPDAS